MTITVVKGLVGKPVEQVTTQNSPNNPENLKNISNAAERALVTNSVGTDAVVNSVRAGRATERGERVDTYKRARGVTEEVKQNILENQDEAQDAHQLNSTGSRSAFVS